MRHSLCHLRQIQQKWMSPRRMPLFGAHPSMRECTPRQVSLAGHISVRYSSYNDDSSDNSKNNKNVLKDFDSLIKASQPSPNPISDEWGDIGEELTGRKLGKDELIPILNRFLQRPSIRQLAAEHGLKPKLLVDAFTSFRKKILDSKTLDPELHIILSDIISSKGHVDDLFPSFLKHAKQVYPHIDCMDDLKKISDLRLPPNWYPQARAINRKFYFHCGPTNSGKTYSALNRFLASKSGIYCGPLKMLAVEVYHKANKADVPCDLVTGEERRFANEDQSPSSHVACTVEMSSVNQPYEVAVIDEIQMVRDPERGWAWTRALLGIVAQEVHLCGEKAALNLIVELLASTGESVEVHEYNRLTKLNVEDTALESLENVKPGDCIVCFGKRDIYSVSLKLEKMGFNVATIYGTLPPATKMLQSNKFNDPADPCNVLVATDAIGMGLNLSIRRIIFYSLIKPSFNSQREKQLDIIPVSQALQIAGRAGRFNTQYPEGWVTTFKPEDLPILKEVLSKPVEEIEAAGLHPTMDQIEMFSYLLPQANLSTLLDIFVSLSQLNPHYFMCNIETIKFLAGILEHIALPLRARYVFCCAPVDRNSNFVGAIFLKYARQYANNQPMNVNLLCRTLDAPFKSPANMSELDHLLNVYDCFDLYLWLSYRFPDIFHDQELVREVQRKLDDVIMEGVLNLNKLLRVSGQHGPQMGRGYNAHSHSRTKKQDSSSSNVSSPDESIDDFDFVKKVNGK